METVRYLLEEAGEAINMQTTSCVAEKSVRSKQTLQHLISVVGLIFVDMVYFKSLLAYRYVGEEAKSDITAMQRACYSGNVEVVKCLVDAGARVCAVSQVWNS